MRTQITLALWLLVAAQASAAVEAEDNANESRWRLGAALGYGLRTNPLVQSDDIPIVVDLDIAWFGDHLFFDNGDLGLTFADNDVVTASFVGRFNSDRVFFGKTNTRFITVDLAGAPLVDAVEFTVPDRDYAVELGIELLTDGAWGKLQLGAFHDVSSTHDGYEVFLDYGYGWRNQRWYVEPSIGASFKSAALNNYYWGVQEDEVSVALPPYQAGSGINTHARLLLSYQLSRHWTFSLVTEYERLNDDAADSPLVTENGVFGYFAGFGFRF
ncbi:MAG: MipA/OmpV family protein [Gammaproteobacteria bacterium]|nr:MipA/OmpV family protein [Gammaproteobacteria bacterium]MDH3374873.1 MipA/OmpV family protein [Gammaproteobacteria bacterium]MDH3552625.1 MipA/OmpV family protein [Gammaproteobacteria bacterium]